MSVVAASAVMQVFKGWVFDARIESANHLGGGRWEYILLTSTFSPKIAALKGRIFNIQQRPKRKAKITSVEVVDKGILTKKYRVRLIAEPVV